MPAYVFQIDPLEKDAYATLRRRLMASIAVLVSTVVIWTFGFVILDGSPDKSLGKKILDGAWDTLNLVSTVGSLNQRSDAERIWSMLGIIFGLGAVLYGFSSLQAMIHSEEILGYYGRRKMLRALDNLNNHIVLCGYGGVGSEVARHATKMGQPVVVIDFDQRAVTEADEAGLLAIRGDATSEQTLHKAGIERANGLIATLNNDAANVYLILIAREMQPDLRIVTRADRSETRSTMQRAGADRVIVPGEIAGERLSHLILKPHVAEFIRGAHGESDWDFAEIEVKDHPNLAGRSIKELDLPRKAESIIISIIAGDGHQDFNPLPDRMIKPDDTLLVVCGTGGAELIDQLQ